MAPDDIRLLLCWMIFVLRDFASTEETTVEVSVRGEPITNNGILVIQCQVWRLSSGSFVNLKLEKADGTGTSVAIAGGTKDSVSIFSNVDRRYFLSTRSFNDGSLVYFLTITEVSSLDEGVFSCITVTLNEDESSSVIFDSVDIKLQHFPSKQYPVCTGASKETIDISDNDVLVLRCSSDLGNPPVNISWHYGSDNANISNRQWIEGEDMIYSELTYTLKMADQGAVFLCHITNDLFSGRKQTCQIGPLSLTLGDVPSIATEAPRTHDKPEPDKKPTNTAVALNCNNSCPQSRSTKFYILCFATGLTTLLCLVFATSTTVLCYKVREKRRLLKESRRSSQSGQTQVDSATGRYARRPQSEPLYMTLEPPEPSQNRNSIVIPKEIYDKYTLSIPRTVNISKL